MNIIRKAFTTLGGIFLAALLITALAPKAAHGIAAALVQVANTTANPVPISDVAPLQPFQGRCNAGDGAVTSARDQCSISIPSGKRLVVQSVSLEVEVTDSSSAVVLGEFTSATSSVAQPTNFYVAVPHMGISQFGISAFAMSQELHSYVDQALGCAVIFNKPNVDTLNCSVAGYLVDIP